MKQRCKLEKDTLLEYSPSRESEILRNRELDTHTDIRMAASEDSIAAIATLGYPLLLEDS